MFDFHFYYTIVLIVAMTTMLVLELIETDIVIFSVLLLMILGGVIDVTEAFQGFANQGMLTVGFLFIVAAALQRTGVLNNVGDALLGNSRSVSKKLLRFLTPVSAISAFFNNTPIVAMLIPVVRYWAKKNQVAVSKLLIPLSYATILGGMCTLIGTSTNLVVHGLMIERGMPGMSFFEISKISIPVAIVGILTVALLVHRLLPSRKELITELSERTREFVVALKVGREYQHVGKTIESAGLRHLRGLFLFQIERSGEIINPVAPEERIQLNDRLFFTGLPETILDLQRKPGLAVIKDASFDIRNLDSDDLGTFEVVISPNSPLIGKNVRESNFRSRYEAVIIAIHRAGERIQKKIGDIVLHSGDTLLIMAKRGFVKRWYHSKDFHLVSKSIDIAFKPRLNSILSLVILAAMIICMAFNLIPILVAVSVAALALILSKCITPHDARNSVDWKVLLVIAAAFGIAQGLENSGVAHYLASQLVAAMGSFGIIGVLFAVYFMTSLYTEVITNNAAAALLVPVAISAAIQINADPRPFLFAVALAASASFATPIGYQTNLMVYGPGGYKFKDFLKVGIPMNLFIGLMVISMIYLIYFIPN
ncbi:MAG TPA: SLC13 family permease [bacterium]|nr:SLC13 family permease [bacterium]